MNEKCSICWDIIGEKEGEVEGGERGKIDCCDHYFCSKCIKVWAEKGCTMCPICRRKFHTIQSDSVGTINVPDKLQENSEITMVWTRIGPGEWTLSDVGDMQPEVMTWIHVPSHYYYVRETLRTGDASFYHSELIFVDERVENVVYKICWHSCRPQKIRHKYKGYTHYFRKRNKYKDMSHYQRLN